MALKLKNLTDIYDMRVYTDQGDYFGDIEESILASNKIFGWRIKATKSSFLTKVLGGAKGVIVPHQLVKAVGDIVIISKAAIPSYEDKEEEESE
ncbi:MAG: PRC-barrel domain-containing protein [Nanoarchaeota archaeon]|nr:PRC-barrel domain-containing protein [Nanoarchaeota archaeon]MCG2718625.1 PRC-barrel domain-containing protein [Nanoarchaeota archaeon]